ncbi:hypothetical protein GCM10011571_34880 [Marinithermofilum abyssi]|uniref:Uncharacterized protein n=1 Tax=Marinithermofilum abyssi TaxID=1571185 RepID=A0A8J2YAL9_9BACL|nr:hypothetical protein [Marinithermofilum abyssi]GGE29722.1 hypothetical protein GCM10011571_34880 [Marinithermofilum abyssi]
MAKKKKKKRKDQVRQQRPARKKMIKESDWYYSREVAPLQRILRRAQHAGHGSVVDEVWPKLKEALWQHRRLIDRAHYIKRP